MLTLLKRRTQDVSAHQHQGLIRTGRNRQQNIKVSKSCWEVFDAIAHAQGMTKAALFEDMVVERLEALKGQGVELS
jgi:hypothetical protein